MWTSPLVVDLWVPVLVCGGAVAWREQRSLVTVPSDGRRGWIGQHVYHGSGWKTEGGDHLTLGERQERHACCLSSGEIPSCVEKEIPSIFPLLFGGIRFYLPDTISPICLQNLLMASRKLQQESLRCS